MVGRLVGVLVHRAVADGVDSQGVLVQGKGGYDGGVACDGDGIGVGVADQVTAPGGERPAGVGGGGESDDVAVVIGRLVGVLDHHAVGDGVDRQNVLLLGEGGRDGLVAVHGDRHRVGRACRVAGPLVKVPADAGVGGEGDHVAVVVGGRGVDVYQACAGDVDRQGWGDSEDSGVSDALVGGRDGPCAGNTSSVNVVIPRAASAVFDGESGLGAYVTDFERVAGGGSVGDALPTGDSLVGGGGGQRDGPAAVNDISLTAVSTKGQHCADDEVVGPVPVEVPAARGPSCLVVLIVPQHLDGNQIGIAEIDGGADL